MESSIRIECKQEKLEGVFCDTGAQKAVAICHPHPLYGGNMDNPVVMTIADAFSEKKISTLRFNFRGTGNSTGTFDNGDGEQEDVRAALSFLVEKGCKEIWLAGYSFGARVNAWVVSTGCDIKDHIMVSPPAGFMSFDGIEKISSTGLIVTGKNDDIAPAELIQRHINRWQIKPRFEVIGNCDHFYTGCLGKLKAILADYLS